MAEMVCNDSGQTYRTKARTNFSFLFLQWKAVPLKNMDIVFCRCGLSKVTISFLFVGNVLQSKL